MAKAISLGNMLFNESQVFFPFFHELHFCTKKGYVECVQYLVGELGFNVDFQRPKDLCTCLHVAAYYDNQPMIKALIDLGADPLMSNKWGEIPKLAQDAGRKGLT